MAKPFFKTVLVGIEIPHERRQLALKRAAQLAQRTDARLILFHSAFSPYSVGPNFYPSTLEQGAKKTLAERKAALEKLAAPLRRRGQKVTVKVAWDYPAYESIVRETLRSKADLVVAESRRQARGARLFLTNTDWQLIRLCPVPLLFAKQTRPYGKARVLAAVDPLHAHAKPARLDERILEVAEAMAAAHSGRLDVVHAYTPPTAYATAGPYGEGFALNMDPQIQSEYRRHVKEALERSVKRLGLPPQQVHLKTGRASSVLPALAGRLRADVLVMGAVSRGGLKRLFIGSTAERTIDELPCDVLIVKPRRFKTPVPRRFTPVQVLPPPLF